MSSTVPLYQGRACCCQPAGAGEYALVTPSGRTIGMLRWHATVNTWVFVPAPGTMWTSGTLADIGMWLRRLQREYNASQSPIKHQGASVYGP